MRIAILTSIEIRHRYFARAISNCFSVLAVVYAKPAYMPSTVEVSGLTADEKNIVAEHFRERERQEQLYFGHDAEFVNDSPQCSVRNVEPGLLNTQETTAFLESRSVDTVVVFGTDLIRPPLLNVCPGRLINLHLGLSPYYRGTATNFYPLLYGEPQFVGATVHLIDAGADRGPILRHTRPTIVAEDMPHTIGCKAIQVGIDAMIAVLDRFARDGHVVGVSQWKESNSRLCLRKDYHPRQVVELYRKIESGLIREFVRSGAAETRVPRLIGEADIDQINPSPLANPVEV